jgi:hypothetical protein
MDAMRIPLFRNGRCAPIFVATHNERRKKMSKFARGISDFLDIVGSAVAVSAATREGRQARASDLQRLGIDPQRFREIRRY